MAPVALAGLPATDAARFSGVIQTLSAYGDRSSGSEGNRMAAAYIEEAFKRLEIEVVGVHSFSVPTMRHGESTLAIPGRGEPIPIHPLHANAVTPQTIVAPGLTGPVVYAAGGKLEDFNGKEMDGAIVLMELGSARHWLQAANLGAKALVYIDRGPPAHKIFFEDKLELSPIQFPRFWMPLGTARELFGQFETAPQGRVAASATLNSDTTWQAVETHNVYCLIEGSDPALREQMILVEAFYDSTAWVGGVSPGADEAVGVATLIDLAHHLKANPPARSVLLVATGGHAQSLAGMRELVWSYSTRSKELRDAKRRLKALVQKTRLTIKALKAPLDSPADADPGEAAEEADAALEPGRLAHEAMQEQVKTESDAVSRRLMSLRMQDKGKVDPKALQALGEERQLLRRLVWRSTFSDLPPEENRVIQRLIPMALAGQDALLEDTRRQLRQLDSASAFRGHAKTYDLAAAVSLHLSSHGDGFGAFNYGFMYPFRPRINRVAAYSLLDEVLRQGAEKLGLASDQDGFFKDTLRPSRKRTWQSYLVDRPYLGGEVTALAGVHGFTLATTDDARALWGTPFDTPEKVDLDFALKQSAAVSGMIAHLAAAARLHEDIFPRNGISEINGRAKFLRHGELFADQPAPGSLLLCYQGPARFYVTVDQMGAFHLKGVADKKHSYHKIIIEGYKFDKDSGRVVWTIDKNNTGKDAYRVKMMRRFMETDLVMFACEGTTIFNLLEPRPFRYMAKPNIIDGRREADPLRWFMSRLDTFSSTISTIFLDPGTPLKMTLSDSYLHKKMLLLNASTEEPTGTGFMVESWPFIHRTEYVVARDMWRLLSPRIANLERRGIFNERIRDLKNQGLTALQSAEDALKERRFDRFTENSARSWALATRVYDDVEKTQKDVLYGVLFYIALFVPFAFCLERLLFCYANIYKRIVAFCGILLLLITVIYLVHPAFRLAYSPTVVILAFFIMGLSLMVTLIIFFRFEAEIAGLQSRAKLAQTGEIGRWKAFVAAFLLGVSNLRRRRLRTALTCVTLIILTFTIMSFTSVKSMRRHARIMYDARAPYQGFLLKNVNWTDLPHEALNVIGNAVADGSIAVPRVWFEEEDRTRAAAIPVSFGPNRFEAQGLVGLSHLETEVSQLDQILVGGRWLSEGGDFEAILPERLAINLGIDPLAPADAEISIWGVPYQVVGVFSSDKLQQRLDLDGEPLTPVTFPREVVTELSDEEAEALESGEDVREFQSRYQHVSAELTMLVSYRTLLAAGGHLKGVAIRTPSQTAVQTAAEDLVDRFGLSLFSGEPEGTFLYNASNTISYSGVPNIIIPLVIAVFIVLNTMISSVFERKREIGIYTSVGLAPSHVSFLFMAEAMAFAVLSVVFGYLLAQTAAKLFAATSLWSGITVNYSSLAGVAAMLLVIAVVLVSTLYPSRVAGQIAIPDVNRSWTLPPAEGNELSLVLPFLMTYREHRSVGGFLYDYFESHQDVSHGTFSTADVAFRFVCESPPSLKDERLDCPQGECDFDQCLHISSRVWLAPFDFGIMQGVDLRFRPASEDPGFLEIQVRLVRESGEANAWRRINKTFLHQIRRQLLVWRSFDDQTKLEYENLLTAAETAMGLRSSE